MGLYEIHKSKIDKEHFGVVIENNTNKNVTVDLFAFNRLFNKQEGVNVYPLYKDMYFKDITELIMWIGNKPLVVYSIKMQSSLSLDVTKKYYFMLSNTDTKGQKCSMPIILTIDYKNPNRVRNHDTPFLLDFKTSLEINVEKYTDLVIKFYHSDKKTFYEKNKRMQIII